MLRRVADVCSVLGTDSVGRESLQVNVALLIHMLVTCKSYYPTKYGLPFQINEVLDIIYAMVLIHCAYVFISKVELCSEIGEDLHILILRVVSIHL
jgi:hypothetical protein